MKKVAISFIFFICALTLFTGCSKDTVSLPPMNGYWLCTGINGTALGINKASIENKYLNLFSIGYVGFATTGYYTRTGATDFSSASSAISTITSGTTGGSSAWSNFFTSGTFTYDKTASTVTHTLKNGETESFKYAISADGNTLTLTKETETSVSGTVNSVVSAINSILGSTTPISTSVGIIYTYKKSSVAEIISSINSAAAATGN